jgi:hypothetical protein
MGSLPGVHRDATCPKREQKGRFSERVGVPRHASFGSDGRRRAAEPIAAERGLEHALDHVHHSPSPFADTSNLFIITLNSLMEWLLMPVALFCNWHIPKRRTLIVIAAVAFYAMRIWSYVYFVPNIFEFGALPPDGPFSAEVVERFRMWVNLNWLRIAIQDLLPYLLFLLAAFVPASAGGTFRKSAGERAVEKQAQSA